MGSRESRHCDTGLPEYEYPVPVIIRNTFLDTRDGRSVSLEEFFEERRIHSCPVAPPEQDPESGLEVPPITWRSHVCRCTRIRDTGRHSRRLLDCNAYSFRIRHVIPAGFSDRCFAGSASSADAVRGSAGAGGRLPALSNAWIWGTMRAHASHVHSCTQRVARTEHSVHSAICALQMKSVEDKRRSSKPFARCAARRI